MRSLLHLHILLHAEAVIKNSLKKNNTYFLFFLFSLISLPAAAQRHDTLASVKVIAKKELNVAATAVPVQVLNKTDLDKINSVSIADAVKYFAGVNVKDYGGIGGLKTVSIRSLGANHTGVQYDGLLLGDAQGGQVDLGKYSLDNVRKLQLFNAGPEEILSPARAFASGALIAVNTISANLQHKGEQEIGIGLRVGSFGYVSPSLLVRTFIGKHFFTGFSGSYQQANGRYPFISYENRSVIEKRNNTDIKGYRLEYDAGYRINDSNKILFKTYYYNSKRGLPGGFVAGNNSNNQRLNDENLFLQSNWQNSLSKKSCLLLSVKFTKDNSFYLDPAYPNSFGKLENDFHQQEFYISTAYKYEICDKLYASYSFDYFNSKLKRTDFLAEGFAKPDRNTFLNNIAVQFKNERTEATANLLYSVINEKVDKGTGGRDLHEFTPAAAFSVAPFKEDAVRFRAFYKKIFRAPTFNDLYYTNIGNVNLRPEYADQFNAGVTLNTKPFSFINKLVLTADGYVNNVKDKILAVPRLNLFQWSMQNVGTVKIKGIDVALHAVAKALNELHFSADIAYSFQEAIDRSKKTSPFFGNQIPYTPKHSGAGNFSVAYRKAVLSYNVLMTSSRYRTGDVDPVNLVGGWVTADVSLSVTLPQQKITEYRIIAEANNIFNAQYEIIKFYPMPRSNFRIGVTASFKKHKT